MPMKPLAPISATIDGGPCNFPSRESGSDCAPLATGADMPSEWRPVDRPSVPFDSSMPDVFAAGDVRHGSVKRVAGAVGEGSVALGSVHQYIAELERATTGRDR